MTTLRPDETTVAKPVTIRQKLWEAIVSARAREANRLLQRSRFEQ
ncbi:hypothetical protein [Rhizobium sp. CFBP 8762]|nr:hypothetical protein [Rhizobium sp. CFBP 8762]